MLEKIGSTRLMEMILSETPERHKDLRCRKEDQRFMYILAFGTNDLITLNKLGLQIFEKCDGSTTVKEIVETLDWGEDKATFTEKLEHTVFCIRDLQKKGIIYNGNPGIVSELGMEA